MTLFERGEIWLADLNPPSGTEPGKTRPVLILQAEALLLAGHPSTLIAPLTTRLVDGAEPLRVRIDAAEALARDSDVLVDQLRSIDNRRLERRLAKLSSCSSADNPCVAPPCICPHTVPVTAPWEFFTPC